MEKNHHWQLRAQKSGHPVLKARYADLVWDFSKIITGESANISNAYILIDATIDIVNQRLFKNINEAIKKLERALFVAICISDKSRIKSLIKTITYFEDKILKNEYPEHCGFAFDNLIENKSIKLSNMQEKK